MIDSNLFLGDHTTHRDYPSLHTGREELIHNGKLLHFREIDKRLDLPAGTARRLLNTVAERYDLEPALESDNVIRYRYIGSAY